VAGTVLLRGRGDSTELAKRKQMIADCNKLAETTSTLSIYFTDAARRLLIMPDDADDTGIAENIRIIREMLDVLRAGTDGIERAAAATPEDGAAHIYTVGIMTHTARIQAPNPEAAVVFYGSRTSGNAMFAAVIYEIDGKKYTGNTAPMLDVQFGKRKLSPEELAKIKKALTECEVVEWDGSDAEAL